MSSIRSSAGVGAQVSSPIFTCGGAIRVITTASGYFVAVCSALIAIGADGLAPVITVSASAKVDHFGSSLGTITGLGAEGMVRRSVRYSCSNSEEGQQDSENLNRQHQEVHLRETET